MTCNSLPRSLVFALLAALSVPTAWFGLGAVIGVGGAMIVFVVAAAIAYSMAIASSIRQAIRIGAFASLLGVPVMIASTTVAEAAFGAAGILAIARSVLLYRSAGFRSLVMELALGTGGLLVASLLAGASVMSLSLAVWGFFLVQSLYFAIGGVSPRRSRAPSESDAFDVARTRLKGLLEEEGF